MNPPYVFYLKKTIIKAMGVDTMEKLAPIFLATIFEIISAAGIHLSPPELINFLIALLALWASPFSWGEGGGGVSLILLFTSCISYTPISRHPRREF
jgi:hypothetical protein